MGRESFPAAETGPVRLIHVSSLAIPYGGGAAGNGLAPLKGLRLTGAQALGLGASALDFLHDRAAQAQVERALQRFGLDPERPGNLAGALAYVWSRYRLPMIPDMPASGKAFDAASEAVMRFAMSRPATFYRAVSGDEDARSEVFDAAKQGLADYVAESRGRPGLVEPALQSNSKRARKAIARELEAGNMVAHHLVPVETWGLNADIARKAMKEGWHVDSPSNLIGLPRDVATQRRLPFLLPLHNSGHPQYNLNTHILMFMARNKYNSPISDLEAKAAMEEVVRENRRRIMSNYYGQILRVTSPTKILWSCQSACDR